MRGLWLERGALRLRDDLPEPAPAAGEAVVAVRVAGVCATDLELTRGYMPFTGVPGHEFVGTIVDCPSTPARIGERVVGEINASCGACPTCRAGRPTHCTERTVLGIAGRDGAFAERLVLPATNLRPVPVGVVDDAAVFTEPLAAAAHVLDAAAVGAGDRVVVVGAGRLGLLVALVLARTGARLQAVARRAFARELLAAAGVEAVADADALPDGAADVVVECSGAPAGLALARRLVRPRGTIVLKSTYAGAVELDLSGVVVDELTLVGSRCGPFAPALDLLATGAVDPTPLIRARYPLDRAVEAFETAARPGALKVLVELPGRY